jgi:hypothetical protein
MEHGDGTGYDGNAATIHPFFADAAIRGRRINRRVSKVRGSRRSNLWPLRQEFPHC